MLGVRPDLVLGETVEGLAHQLEVLAQVARAFGAGQARQYRRVALRRQEGAHRRRPAGLDAPEGFASGDTADQIRHDIGHEGGGNASLDVTERAVLQRGPRRRHCRGRMGHVVGDHLVRIDAAALAHGGTGLVHQALGQINRVSGAGEVPNGGRRHGKRP